MSENMKQTPYACKALYNCSYFTELTEEESINLSNKTDSRTDKGRELLISVQIAVLLEGKRS